MIRRQRGPPVLKTSTGVAALVFDEDASAFPLGRCLPDKPGDVFQLDERGIPHAGAALDAPDIFEGVAGSGHQPFVIKCDRGDVELVVIDAQDRAG